MKSVSRYFLIKDVQILLLVVSIFISSAALFLAFKAHKSSKIPFLIGIDQNGTRVIHNHDDPLFKSELVNFIRVYIQKLYNFKPESFDANVGFATGYMSEELWNLKKDQILSLKSKVLANQIQVETKLSKISKENDGSYKIDLKSTKLSRASRSTRNFQLKLSLAKTDRTQKNPYGIEVTNYEEIY